MHTRCFAESRHSKTGEAASAQIVGHLARQEGRWMIVDCDGDIIPYGKVLELFEGHLITININNLDYSYQKLGSTITRDVHHDGP